MSYEDTEVVWLDRTVEAFKKVSADIALKIKDFLKSRNFRNFIKGLILSGKILVLLFIIYLAFFIVPPVLQEYALSKMPDENSVFPILTGKQQDKLMKKLETSNNSLAKKLERKTPQQPYIVINSSENKFKLYKGKDLIREGVCSTGSYIMLQAADERKWIFKTPRGMFRIQGKTTYPVWIKPDWAFIEEGLPVPATNAYERYEYGVLGDYALSLGFGYLIHGTLYQRFLGMPVTHGCIRLGDDDLKAVYRTLDISSKVFIF